MTEYPYYVVARIDAGQMVKIFGDRKFKSYVSAVDAMHKKYERLSKAFGHSMFELSQIVIIEYTKQYQGKICSMYSFGKFIKIIEPDVIK